MASSAQSFGFSEAKSAIAKALQAEINNQVLKHKDALALLNLLDINDMNRSGPYGMRCSLNLQSRWAKAHDLLIQNAIAEEKARFQDYIAKVEAQRAAALKERKPTTQPTTGWIMYEALTNHTTVDGQAFTRAHGAIGLITPNMLGGQTNPNPNITWPGFNGLFNSRSHLIAAMMGGSNTDRRNFVMLLRSVNSPTMRTCELDVRDAVKSGEKVYYLVEALYADDTSPMPAAMVIRALGDKGFYRQYRIFNE
jgi:hypothetical protein